MPSASAQRDPSSEYLSCIEREEELGQLRKQADARKSMLVFGRKGSGNRACCRHSSGNIPLHSTSPRCELHVNFYLHCSRHSMRQTRQ